MRSKRPRTTRKVLNSENKISMDTIQRIWSDRGNFPLMHKREKFKFKSTLGAR